MDLGVDRRFGRNLTVSADTYQTLVRDQFLTTAIVAIVASARSASEWIGGAYGIAPGTYPICVSQTENLGHSQYKGVEVSVNDSLAVELAFKVNGALLHAYTYDLPPGFYNSAAGPNPTNLGILPEINFQANPLGQVGGLSQSRVPYAEGYAEVNWTGRGCDGGACVRRDSGSGAERSGRPTLRHLLRSFVRAGVVGPTAVCASVFPRPDFHRQVCLSFSWRTDFHSIFLARLPAHDSPLTRRRQ